MELPPLPAPPERLGNEVMSPTLPLPPPKDRESLGRFVELIASVPRDRTDELREAIRSIKDAAGIAALIHQSLFSLPCEDIGRHLLLLSILGELADPSSVDALDRFVWLSDSDVYGPAASRPLGGCDFGPAGMLQSRAAEMLVWVARGRHDERIFRILGEHPAITVRVAAIDAFLFQQGDSADAIALLEERVQADDRWAVGLPRRGPDVDMEAFDRRADAHEAEHGEPPPPPEKHERTSDVH